VEGDESAAGQQQAYGCAHASAHRETRPIAIGVVALASRHVEGIPGGTTGGTAGGTTGGRITV
jgi:hypothetical protein